MSSQHNDSEQKLASRRVNIIYIRGSVNSFLPFLNSLIDLTELPLRLVSNGCDRAEERLLKDLCDKSERLEFYSLESKEVLEHGKALDHLVSIEQSELFSFMDSDIFATGPVSLTDIQPRSGDSLNTSCLPAWLFDDETTMPEQYRVMGGEYLKSSNGHFLGCSYLASYRVHHLRELTNGTGLSFRSYDQKDLPPNVLETLIGIGLKKARYDTGKIINLLLQHRGHKLSYRPVEGLVHVGAGSSRLMVKKNDPMGFRKFIRSLLPQFLLTDIRRRRFNFTKPEAEDHAKFAARRSKIWRQLDEFEKGPPFSKSTTELIAKDETLKKISEVFSIYGNG